YAVEYVRRSARPRAAANTDRHRSTGCVAARHRAVGAGNARRLLADPPYRSQPDSAAFPLDAAVYSAVRLHHRDGFDSIRGTVAQLVVLRVAEVGTDRAAHRHLS